MDHVTSVPGVLADAPRWPEPSPRLPRFTAHLPPRHVHLIPSLTLGGAERIVADLGLSLSESGAEMDLLLLRASALDRLGEHRAEAQGVMVHRLVHLSASERQAFAAGIVLASRLPAYCHLLRPSDLEPLWRLGCRTVPVIHNAPEGWMCDPRLFDVPEVPFVAACGEAVARALVAAGLRKPVKALRHVVPAAQEMSQQTRDRVRSAFRASPEHGLIGMVGRFAPQKNYPLAVRVLAELRRRGREVRLAIVGGTFNAGARIARAEVHAEAQRLGVRDHLVMPGPVADAASIIGAFDVFLNTSRFEGVSLATMEAAAYGVPVVSAAVGGQAEAIGATDMLVAADAGITRWADAIETVLARPRPARPVRDRRIGPTASQIWPWTLVLGPGARPPPQARRRADILFVTANLDAGGAQRSLCNLVAELATHGFQPVVAVAGACGVPGFMAAARDAGVTFIDLSGDGGLAARAGRVLSLVQELAPRTMMFWNMDAATKIVVVKAMAGGPTRVVDVSPGPMLYRELDSEAALGRSLSMEPDHYLAALDMLVAKHATGGPPPSRGQPRGVAIIPNGVPDAGEPLPPWDGPSPPPGADPRLAVVTVGRLVAAKRLDLLPRVARALQRAVPGATLTVVGGLHAPSRAWQDLLRAMGDAVPDNLVFAGPDHRTLGFLGRFACFYMVSTDQGCPNASLEAMSAGLPVVANPDGGTAEQVEHGVTGYLVPVVDDPEATAEAFAIALALVLRDPARARRMGEAGQRRARERFSMSAMAEAYADMLRTNP